MGRQIFRYIQISYSNLCVRLTGSQKWFWHWQNFKRKKQPYFNWILNYFQNLATQVPCLNFSCLPTAWDESIFVSYRGVSLALIPDFKCLLIALCSSLFAGRHWYHQWQTSHFHCPYNCHHLQNFIELAHLFCSTGMSSQFTVGKSFHDERECYLYTTYQQGWWGLSQFFLFLVFLSHFWYQLSQVSSPGSRCLDTISCENDVLENTTCKKKRGSGIGQAIWLDNNANLTRSCPVQQGDGGQRLPIRGVLN